ncbi:hypothetical protein D1871_10285 [Nakamurella silvestris]|nr:hypothetical protein D1871_10285 [Nakamurella silvestris]
MSRSKASVDPALIPRWAAVRTAAVTRDRRAQPGTGRPRATAVAYRNWAMEEPNIICSLI